MSVARKRIPDFQKFSEGNKENLKNVNNIKSFDDLKPIKSFVGNSKKPSWGNVNKQQFFVELSKFGYVIKKRIGGGSYSKVYYAEYYRPKFVGQKSELQSRPSACKVIDRRDTSIDFCRKFLPREISILKTINHPHIVGVQSILEMGPFVCVFMDFCPNGDLLDRIKSKGALTERRSKLYFYQICSAVHYLHSRGISHRDIKCENILIESRFYVKLTDFGFSRYVEEDKSKANYFSRTFCGSTAYAAPEVLKGIAYDPKALDMWSLGCVLFIMIFGVMPFDDEDIARTIKRQDSHQIEFPKQHSCSKMAIHMIRQLLQPNVQERYQIEDVVDNQWINA